MTSADNAGGSLCQRRTLSRRHDLSDWHSMTVPAPLTLAAGVTREYLLHHRLCPKSTTDDGSLVLATTADSLLSGADDIAFAYGRSVAFETVPREELERLIERLTTRSERTIELAKADSATDTLSADVRDLANQPPVIRFVNLLVREA